MINEFDNAEIVMISDDEIPSPPPTKKPRPADSKASNKSRTYYIKHQDQVKARRAFKTLVLNGMNSYGEVKDENVRLAMLRKLIDELAEKIKQEDEEGLFKKFLDKYVTTMKP